MSPPIPAFLIVGAPRSGTTLVQRLACELPGVTVPPETHFFTKFAPALVGRRHLPLDEGALREELEMYVRMKHVDGLLLNIGAVVDDLGGACTSLVDLFSAVLCDLTGRGASVVGEKTPEHLLWWRPLARALPGLKIVAVVRDPRAVLASRRRMPWGVRSDVAIIQEWRMAYREIRAARAVLGPQRCLALQYEKVVVDPDGTRAALAQILGVPTRSDFDAPSRSDVPMFLESEPWKAEATGPITTNHINEWAAELTERQIRIASAMCSRELGDLGLSADGSQAMKAGQRTMSMTPRERYQQLHALVHDRLRIAKLRHYVAPRVLSWPSRPGAAGAASTRRSHCRS